MSLSPTMAYLESIFPGQALVPAVKAGEALGYAQSTTRNKLVAGEFPIKTTLIGNKRVVRKTDLADYIDSLADKRGPGRPKGSTKAARLAAAEARHEH